MPTFIRSLCAYGRPEKGADTLALDASERHHLITVQRARLGETVTVFDGNGQEWECRIAGIDSKTVALVIQT